MAIERKRVFPPAHRKGERRDDSIRRFSNLLCWTECSPASGRRQIAELCFAREADGFLQHRLTAAELKAEERVYLSCAAGLGSMHVWVPEERYREFLVSFEGKGALVPIAWPWPETTEKITFLLARLSGGVLFLVLSDLDDLVDVEYYLVKADGAVTPVKLAGGKEVLRWEIRPRLFYSIDNAPSGGRVERMARQWFEERDGAITVHQGEPFVAHFEPDERGHVGGLNLVSSAVGGGLSNQTLACLFRSGAEKPQILRAEEIARSLGLPDDGIRFRQVTLEHVVVSASNGEFGLLVDGKVNWSQRLTVYARGTKPDRMNVSGIPLNNKIVGMCDDLLFVERDRYQLQVYSLRTRKFMLQDVERVWLGHPCRWGDGYLLRDHQQEFVWFDGPSLRGDHMQQTERELLAASLGADADAQLPLLAAAGPGVVPEGLAGVVERRGHAVMLEALLNAHWNGIAEEDFWIESSLAAVIDAAVAKGIRIPKETLLRLIQECCYEVIVVAALKAYGVFCGTPTKAVGQLVLARWPGHNAVYYALPEAAKFV